MACVPSVEPVKTSVAARTGKASWLATCSCGWRAEYPRQQKHGAQSDAIEHANTVRPVLRESKARPSAQERRSP